MSSPSLRQSSTAARDVLESQAADWIARRNGGLTPNEEAGLAAWLATDAQHAAAFAAMEHAWAKLNAPRLSADSSVAWVEIEAFRRARARTRRRTWVATALGLAAAIAMVATVGRILPVAPRDVLARVDARPVIRTLVDGTKVALKPGAEIEVSYTSAQRHVRLLRGEALFTVTKNPTRPFIVTTRGVAVQAVGTEFAVREEAHAVDVLVTEGEVAVSLPVSGANPPEIAPVPAIAGQRVTVPVSPVAGAPTAPTLSAPSPAQIASALAWRGRRLEFSDTPLAEALQQFNREGPPELVLADPAMGTRTITGVIWADDAEGFVRLLETGFDLAAERDGPRVRLHAVRK